MTAAAGTAQGLSCYTANLAGYLAAEWDAGSLLAASVRLAVRVDLADQQVAFSHHGTPLDRLPDGTRLRYHGTPAGADALAGLTADLDRYGRVLVVVDNARLPWSPAYGRDLAAPHWLLVTGRERTGWRVVDEFTGLLEGGHQASYAGWLDTAELSAALEPPRWRPEQRRRNALAFGFPVPVPVGRAQWLGRVRDDIGPSPLPGRWLTGDAQVLPYLAEHLAGHGAQAARHLDDCWAAAGHRAFAYRWRLAHANLDGAERHRLDAALPRWESLPRLLRYAVESAQRGRARPGLVRRAFDDLLRAEADRGGTP